MLIPGNPWWLGLCSFIAEGTGSIPGQGTKILQTMQHSQNKQTKRKEIKKHMLTHDGFHTQGRRRRAERG